MGKMWIHLQVALLSFLVALVAWLAGSPNSPENGPRQPQRIVGYYASWGTYSDYEVADIPAASLTHVNYAFANIANGVIVPGDLWADTNQPFPGDCAKSGCLKGNFRQLLRLKTQFPDLRTLISVGGWTWSKQFSNIALTAAARAKFADSAVAFIRKYGFNGVDLDWEYPVSGGESTNVRRPQDRTNFTLLLQAIRDRLDEAGEQDGKAYLLTIAAGAFPGYLNHVEAKKIGNIVDWVNLMAYDFRGDWQLTAGHHAPLYADTADSSDNFGSGQAAAQQWIDAGVPAAKLVLGIPLYGRGWSGCPAAGGGLNRRCAAVAPGTAAPGVFNFGDLANRGWTTGADGFTRHYDASAQAPWLYEPKSGTFISYEDDESVAAKADFIRRSGLGGAMFWELGQDPDAVLVRTMHDSLNELPP